ncbi:RNA recognition motif domain-containing protein [Taibaiella helva]|uniref:RNA recognition motif domain-containing protein n=1 Tax=Taibaiella helva TaxID=2301235 RepID=UPI000E58F207
MNIFVSNLSVSAHKSHLKNLFSEFGKVRSIIVIRGYFSKKTDTSCWVVIDNRADAENAIRNLDHSIFMEKTIGVSEAILLL